MATASTGNVSGPVGTISGVSSPIGAPAVGKLNLGSILQNFIGPIVNGGAGLAPASPLAGKPKAAASDLPANKQSVLPVVLLGAAVFAAIRWL